MLPTRKTRSTPRDEAKRFLEQALADGPRPASELIEEADARGLSRRTVQRAFHDLAGHTRKHGLRAGWWWSLGEFPIAPIPDQPFATIVTGEPTYSTDVAEQISFDRLTACIQAEIARRAELIAASESPSAHVTPSQKPRQKSHPTPERPLSPSPPVSPSRPPLRTPAPPAPIHTRPQPKPSRQCTEPQHP